MGDFDNFDQERMSAFSLEGGDGEGRAPEYPNSYTNSNASNSSDISNTPKTSNISKDVFVSIDTTPEEVLKLQSEGMSIYFKDQDQFLSLSDEIVEGLSYVHRQRYFIAEQITRGTLDTTPSRRFTKMHSMNPASARSRLSVSGLKPGMVGTWQYEDEIPFLEDAWGLRAVVDEDVKSGTPMNAGRTRTITQPDGRKLVLCEYPEAQRDLKEKGEREKAARYAGEYDESAESSLRSRGASVLTKKDLRETKNLNVRMDEGV